MDNNEKITRRFCLIKAALFTAAAGTSSSLLPSSSSAQTKASKSAVQYQDHPKGMQMCGMCRFFISANGRRGGMMGGGMMGNGMGGGMMRDGMGRGHLPSCGGGISPMGYCILYASA